MHAEPPLSNWARDKFGERAALVRRIVAESILDAITNAQDAQEASKTDRAYPFAFSLLPRKFEAIREGFEGKPEVTMVRPHGSIHEMTVVSGNLLFPFCFAKDRSINVMKAKITEDKVSGLAKVLFALFGPERTIEQLTIDTIDDEESKKLIAVADSLSRLPEGTKLLLVAYSCNFKAGLLELWWGEAELLDDQGNLKWTNCEEIPLPKTAPADGRRPKSIDDLVDRPVVPRFDEGPMPSTALTARPAVEMQNEDAFPPRSENQPLTQDVADDEGS